MYRCPRDYCNPCIGLKRSPSGRSAFLGYRRPLSRDQALSHASVDKPQGAAYQPHQQPGHCAVNSYSQAKEMGQNVYFRVRTPVKHTTDPYMLQHVVTLCHPLSFCATFSERKGFLSACTLMRAWCTVREYHLHLQFC